MAIFSPLKFLLHPPKKTQTLAREDDIVSVLEGRYISQFVHPTETEHHPLLAAEGISAGAASVGTAASAGDEVGLDGTNTGAVLSLWVPAPCS